MQKNACCCCCRGGQPHLPASAEAWHVLTRTASVLPLYRLQLMEASQYRMLGKAEWDAAMAEDFLVGAAKVLLGGWVLQCWAGVAFAWRGSQAVVFGSVQTR